jgi:hypothetical protein
MESRASAAAAAQVTKSLEASIRVAEAETEAAKAAEAKAEAQAALATAAAEQAAAVENGQMNEASDLVHETRHAANVATTASAVAREKEIAAGDLAGRQNLRSQKWGDEALRMSERSRDSARAAEKAEREAAVAAAAESVYADEDHRTGFTPAQAALIAEDIQRVFGEDVHSIRGASL